MTLRAIPPGFASREEALERANEKWGRRDAMGKMKGLLTTGELIGWNGYDDRYPPHQLTSEFWRTSDAWGLIEDGESYPRARRTYFLLFKAEDLDIIFPISVATESPSSDQGLSNGSRLLGVGDLPLKNVGGNPGKYDWDEMWIEVVGQLFVSGNFDDLSRKSEVAFRKKMQEWFVAEIGTAPDDTIIVPKIRKLFERLQKVARTD